ncbi:MAG: hypothetical protein CMH12_09075 [Maritimibacter sp.]|nr:hypothetical protein [Maritimibacter sp.]
MPLEDDRLKHAFGFAGIGRWEFSYKDRSLFLDSACRDLFEVSEAEASSQTALMTRVAEEDRERAFGALDALSKDGEVYDETFRMNLPSGTERWLRGVARYRASEDGDTIIGVSFDVTTEQKLLADREIHLAEINHRIKNLFALVSAMISNASRESADKTAMVDNLRGRVAALDRAHSLMLKTDVTQPIPLRALIDQILAPARGDQMIEMTGEEVLIPAKAATSLVLILHEWVTNSAKYGSLREKDGAIRIHWEPYENGVHIGWRERVPDYDTESSKGFGSSLIQAAAMQLRAEKVRRVEDGWLIIDMKLPLDGY